MLYSYVGSTPPPPHPPSFLSWLTPFVLPYITVTLVPQIGTPKIRNLELGNSKIDVKNADQSLASKSAHASAKIMGVPPGGAGVTTSPGCSCSCSVS